MRATAATLRAAFGEATANRASLASQVTVMVLNDVAWVVFWLILFDRVGEVRGWDARRVMLLLAVLTTAGGLVLGLLANARRIGQLALDGGLDAALALPVRPLGHLLVRRVEPINFGDVVFGVALFAISGPPSVTRTLVFAFGVLAGATVLAGFLVATGSLALLVGRDEGSELSFHAVLLLASYPADLFTGVARTLVHVAVPAAFVATVPSRLVDRFDPATAGVVAGAAAAFAALGWAAFTAGLRRYTSGATWTRP